VDGTGSGSCSVAGFHRNVEPSSGVSDLVPFRFTEEECQATALRCVTCLRVDAACRLTERGSFGVVC
jgi:hypothetical protein